MEASSIRAGVPITSAIAGIKNPIVLIAAPGPYIRSSKMDRLSFLNSMNAGISPKK